MGRRPGTPLLALYAAACSASAACGHAVHNGDAEGGAAGSVAGIGGGGATPGSGAFGNLAAAGGHAVAGAPMAGAHFAGAPMAGAPFAGVPNASSFGGGSGLDTLRAFCGREVVYGTHEGEPQGFSGALDGVPFTLEPSLVSRGMMPPNSARFNLVLFPNPFPDLAGHVENVSVSFNIPALGGAGYLETNPESCRSAGWITVDYQTRVTGAVDASILLARDRGSGSVAGKLDATFIREDGSPPVRLTGEFVLPASVTVWQREP